MTKTVKKGSGRSGTTTQAKSGAGAVKTKNKSRPQLSPKKTAPPSKNSTSASTVQLKVGQKAPPFILFSQAGKKVSLTDYRGKRVVLYFYPKDDTPGCTKEACAFRDSIEEINESGAVVLGVSADSVDSHKKFAQKFNLNFPILSDVDKKMVQAYGVWKEKSLYGRTFMGIERSTFIIDEQGKIAEIFSKVKVDSHLEEVLGELELIR